MLLFAACDEGAAEDPDVGGALDSARDRGNEQDLRSVDATGQDVLHQDARDRDVPGDATRDGGPLDALADRSLDGPAPDTAVPDAATPDLGPPDAAALPPARTELTEDGRLALRAEGPARVLDCPGCSDRDGDGLVDVWESLVLDRFRPLLRFDELEQLIDDEEGVLRFIGRVAPVEGRVRVFLVVAYSRDYGACVGISSHDGDTERVALDLALEGAGDAVMVGAYTAAHEYTAFDESRTFVGVEMEALRFTEGEAPRWLVYPARDKHGTYANLDICENVSPIPCVDEDCAPDGVADPERFDVLPPVYNAGEDEARLLDDLGRVGFPGERAWGEGRFCGGRAGAGGGDGAHQPPRLPPRGTCSGTSKGYAAAS